MLLVTATGMFLLESLHLTISLLQVVVAAEHGKTVQVRQMVEVAEPVVFLMVPH
jgi:hypothetical protein